MKPTNLTNLLSIFKQSREKMALDFINEDIELFNAMFKYEDNSELMDLTIEKYLIRFINYHFEIFKQSESVDEDFNKTMLKFLEEFNINTSNKNLFLMLIEEKKFLLEEIIKIGDKNTIKYNKLAYSYEKEKRLFDREIQKMKE